MRSLVLGLPQLVEIDVAGNDRLTDAAVVRSHGRTHIYTFCHSILSAVFAL